MKLTYNTIHTRFKLNGQSYSNAALIKHATYLIKQTNTYKVAIGSFLLEWLNSSATLKVTTSGSTGKPKEIVLKKEHMVNSAIATGTFFNLKAGQKALNCLPTNFIAGKMMLVRAMVLGLEIDCVLPSTSPIENIDDNYDFSAMVPMQLQHSLHKIQQIKTLLVGGAPMAASLKKEVQDKSTFVFETYGMTETITHIAVKRINNFTNSNERNYFKVLPSVYISKDTRDCLVIQAPKISNETAIITNDIVTIVSETEFEWLGRYDSVINSGGIKLIPEQIEAKLASSISNRFFVVGIPDVRLGQKLVLVIEGTVDIATTHKKIKSLKTLERFQIPKEIFVIASFLETENGKIQRIKTLELLKK